MKPARTYYLFHIQFFGYRYHGWMKQPGLKTIQSQIEKTFHHLFDHDNFKTIASSRTDSKVSANHFVFELFSEEQIDIETFLPLFNYNLPNDIRGLKIEQVDKTFNIIQASKTKEYHYFFASGQKFHPFSAGLVMSFRDPLDIPLMQEGAKIFEGTYNFRRYCALKKTPVQTGEGYTEPTYIRTIEHCSIRPNTELSANYLPPETYVLHVRSSGFMRYQVRLMMGQLLSLGRHETTLADLRETLLGNSEIPVRYIAPASGLVLNKIEFKDGTASDEDE